MPAASDKRLKSTMDILCKSMDNSFVTGMAFAQLGNGTWGAGTTEKQIKSGRSRRGF
jgi:hypothetical protein